MNKTKCSKRAGLNGFIHKALYVKQLDMIVIIP